MTRWIDHPDWADETAKRLIAVLVEAVRKPDQLEQVWAEADLETGVIDIYNNAPKWAWIAMVKEAAKQQGKLEALLDRVVKLVPAAKTEINAVLAIQLKGLTWYVSPDRYSARLVGPGSSKAMLDRGVLRQALTSIVQDGYSVVAITGCAGSGKSHSKHLIQHVAADPNIKCKVVVFDLDSEWPERRSGKIKTLEFVRRFAEKLAGPALSADLLTDYTRTARELATAFVGWYQRLDAAHRWIFIDGLDRDEVHPGVHEFVSFLAGEVVDYQLEDTRLIVTGHPGNFPPRVLEMVVEERLDPLDDSHLELFFEGIAADVQVKLPPEEIGELVRKVRAQADFTNLEQLGKVASSVARDHFHPLVA